jgi:hypothetical protein
LGWQPKIAMKDSLEKFFEYMQKVRT